MTTITSLKSKIDKEFDQFNDNDRADHEHVIRLHASIDQIQQRRERRTDKFIQSLNDKFLNWRRIVRIAHKKGA